MTIDIIKCSGGKFVEFLQISCFGCNVLACCPGVPPLTRAHHPLSHLVLAHHLLLPGLVLEDVAPQLDATLPAPVPPGQLQLSPELFLLTMININTVATRDNEDPYSKRMMKFDIMVLPLEVLVVVVVDHLEVERDVGAVSVAAALLVVLLVKIPLVHAVPQLVLRLLHLIPRVVELLLETLLVLLSPESALNSVPREKFFISSILWEVKFCKIAGATHMKNSRILYLI